MTLERAWYHCPACGHGFSARDRALGVENTSWSPAVRRMVGITAAETSFGHASAVLRELAGVEVGAKQVERHAEALGRDIARDEVEVVDAESSTAATLYVGLDGTGVPVRKAETAGRAGKQPDGSAKTREVKLLTVWSAEGRGKDGLPCRDPGSVSCNGAIESIAARDTDREPSPFAKRVLRELERRCVDLVERRVVLGDGAAWIWNFADEHLPDAIQIVDIFHAKQHVFDVAKAIYGLGSDLAAQWGKARRRSRRRRPAAARVRLRRGEEEPRLLHRQSRAHGLSDVSRHGTVRLHRRRRGRLQIRDRQPPQARRHALDRQRRQRRHRPAMRHRQQPLRRLLGASGGKILTPAHKFDVHPVTFVLWD